MRRTGSFIGNGLLLPLDDWGWLALAQHHGMAIRLLERTDNPLVAL
jgi:hypothetical protein